jgi:hypothetical protein
MYRNPTTFATDPSQFYQTEPRDTEAIANYLQTHHPELKRVFEPCYGNGAIANILEEYGLQVTVQRDKYTLPNKHDFLTDELPDPSLYDVIVTNTPFAKKLDFFQRLIQTNKPFASIFPID